MPLRDDLLNPIPGSNPSGEDLRYAPVYDKIKEARREDDPNLPQGIWTHQLKKGDYPQVIKLTSESLATKSKDLQLAVWLIDAVIKTEALPGLRQGLELIRNLQGKFWDTLYPQLEDGDAELRAAPLDWLITRVLTNLKLQPLTRNGLDWFKYTESRTVGYEKEAAGNADRTKARNAAIKDGKLTAEQFDQALKETPKSFYEQVLKDIDDCLEVLAELREFSEGKFGDNPPSFGKLVDALEEYRPAISALLEKKIELETPPPPSKPAPAPPAPSPAAAASAPAPAAVASPPPAPKAAEPPAPTAPPAVQATPPAAQVAPKPPASGPGADPIDREDANRRTIAVARYLRKQQPTSPVSYMVLRGLRWGELRAKPDNIDPLLLEAPPPDSRQQLKRFALEGKWAEVLEAAETAMGLPCGRAWLDIQRYVIKACQELGRNYNPVVAAIRSELRNLLTDFPKLPQLTLMDDTPAANQETQAWLKDYLNVGGAGREGKSWFGDGPTPAETKATVLDAFEMASQAAKSSRVEKAIEIMTRQIAQEGSGRGRFQRRSQLAQICVSTGNEAVAFPILEEIAAEIEHRKLEDWEAPDTVAQPLALLFRCLDKLKRSPEEKQKIYQQICRLDPGQALVLGK